MGDCSSEEVLLSSLEGVESCESVGEDVEELRKRKRERKGEKRSQLREEKRMDGRAKYLQIRGEIDVEFMLRWTGRKKARTPSRVSGLVRFDASEKRETRLTSCPWRCLPSFPPQPVPSRPASEPLRLQSPSQLLPT